MVIFGLAIILGTIFTWNSIFSLLPLIGMMANLYGQWQDNMKRIRILAIVSAALWLIYAFYTKVYTAMLTEILKITSSSIGLWRFRNGVVSK